MLSQLRKLSVDVVGEGEQTSWTDEMKVSAIVELNGDDWDEKKKTRWQVKEVCFRSTCTDDWNLKHPELCREVTSEQVMERE